MGRIIVLILLGAIAVFSQVPFCANSWQVSDCNGVCVNSTFLGDGFCDDGAIFNVTLNCWLYGCDRNDCPAASCAKDCAPGLMRDCVGICRDPVSKGNGVCDAPFNCPYHNCDGYDCVPQPSACCGNLSMIADCTGNCEPVARLGDGVCDKGDFNVRTGIGSPLNNCVGLGYDHGDCRPCPPGQVFDCAYDCYPTETIIPLVGNGHCNVYPDPQLWCSAWRYDGGDCKTCAPGFVPDCTGLCFPKISLGNGVCDVLLNCTGWLYDNGDCIPCPTGYHSDCNYGCSNLRVLGDGVVCNPQWNCAKFRYDMGDCQAPILGGTLGTAVLATTSAAAASAVGDGLSSGGLIAIIVVLCAVVVCGVIATFVALRMRK